MKNLQQYYKELDQECLSILDWWMLHSIDYDNGGFFGKIDNDNVVMAGAPKGSVLNSRILWTFSAAYNHYKTPGYLQTATRAYNYIATHFVDTKYGGVYWSVDDSGKPLDDKKQVYAIAFAVYGLSEYVLACGDVQAKELALDLYQAVEKHSHDSAYGGYFEAFTREWNELEDLRLSNKDFNEKKSMNTNLHVLEAYTNLYRIHRDEILRKNIEDLIRLFLVHIIDQGTNHLILFFSEQWTPKSELISYGHDIEAAWLLQEAAQVIGHDELLGIVKQKCLDIAKAAAKGLDTDGGLWYEKNVAENHVIKEKHWWPQAEAMVGFFNAWQVSGEPHFLQKFEDAWSFIKKHLQDREDGEWFWGVHEDYSIMQEEDKAGLWKCPYHNGRACLELMKRIKANQ